MTELYIQDVTLRDGMHAIRHRIAPEHVARDRRRRSTRPASTPSRSPTATASPAAALNYGPGSHTDWEWIEAAAAVLQHAELTTLLLPGIGTIARPQAGLLPRASARCASPPTAPRPTSPPSTSRPPASSAWTSSGFLMMTHMADPAELAAAGQADGVLRRALRLRHRLRWPADHGRRRATGCAPTATSSTPDTEIGIHAHENLSLSVANSVVAVEEGVYRVDASLAGQGAGAGNCPDRGVHRRRRPAGLEARLRPVRAAGRRRRPRPPAAGPAGPGRPGDADARLRRRLLAASCATPRSPPSATASTPATLLLEVGRRRTGRRPGGHDRRHRPRHGGRAGGPRLLTRDPLVPRRVRPEDQRCRVAAVSPRDRGPGHVQVVGEGRVAGERHRDVPVGEREVGPEPAVPPRATMSWPASSYSSRTCDLGPVRTALPVTVGYLAADVDLAERLPGANEPGGALGRVPHPLVWVADDDLQDVRVAGVVVHAERRRRAPGRHSCTR